MRTLLTTTQQSRGDAVIVTARGDVDLSTAEQFATALAEAARRGRLLVADLAGLGFLGSAGLAVLVSAAAEDTRMVVVAAEGTIARRALVATGLDQALVLAPDLDSALRLAV